MKQVPIRNPIGTMPLDREVCALLTDNERNVLCEAYVYRAGFFRFNWHPSMEILFVIKGALNVYTEHGIFQLKEDDFLVISANEGHASMLEAPETIAAVMHISQEYLDRVCRSDGRFPCIFHPAKELDKTSERIRSAFAEFYLSLSVHSGTGARICAEGKVMEIVGTLMMKFVPDRIPLSSSASPKQRQKLRETITYIDEHFLQPLTLEEVAAYVGMNPSYLSVFLKKHMRIGFHEYLTRKRLGRAIWLLNNAKHSILAIAEESGFPDAKALHAAFKKYFKITPNTYRKMLRCRQDSNAENIHPLRLPLHNPMVKEKLLQYIKSPGTYSDGASLDGWS